jgi:hypothetical protein
VRYRRGVKIAQKTQNYQSVAGVFNVEDIIGPRTAETGMRAVGGPERIDEILNTGQHFLRKRDL